MNEESLKRGTKLKEEISSLRSKLKSVTAMLDYPKKLNSDTALNFSISRNNSCVESVWLSLEKFDVAARAFLVITKEQLISQIEALEKEFESL